jgi:hypothetical protein
MTTKRLIVSLAALLTFAAGTAHAGDVGFSIGINLGTPVSYAPVYAPAPVPVQPPPPVVLYEPPQFIIPQNLGFQVAVGVPYDLFRVADSYYVCRNNAWYRGPSYRGPWTTVRYRTLPGELRRYPVATIRSYRDNVYRSYGNGQGWGQGRHYPPGQYVKEVRHGERWQEARQWGKGHNRHGHGDDD